MQVKIWKWLKLLNYVHSSRKHLKIMFTFEFDHFDWLFPPLQWMNTNFKISQFSKFLLRSEYAIQVKFRKWLNFLILFHSSRKHWQIISTFEFGNFDWLSQLYSEWRQTSNLVSFKISAKVLLCDFGQDLTMTKTS